MNTFFKSTESVNRCFTKFYASENTSTTNIEGQRHIQMIGTIHMPLGHMEYHKFLGAHQITISVLLIDIKMYYLPREDRKLHTKKVKSPKKKKVAWEWMASVENIEQALVQS